MSTSDRSLAVLKLFSIDKPVWTAEEISTALSVSLATSYRYLASLDEAGLVAAATVGHYGLGPAIVQLDRQIQLTDPLLKAARPVMADLSKFAPDGSAILLCRPAADCVLCIHQVLTTGPQEPVSYERGRPMPLFFGATSKVILANQPARGMKAIYAQHVRAIEQAGLGTSFAEFRDTLAAWRKSACMVTHSDVDPGRTGIAAPILNEARTAIGSLSYVVPHTTEERVVGRLATLVSAGAREIEGVLVNNGVPV
ncbi:MULTISPECIES: IclR family transcriptional regulator C-terminal domain-containing protein [Burkholderia]|uniref:IclR family transcriptional regulator n=1 Tax=Burkholderia TaxID=32008 RepID=UPI001453A43E|nr:MULTISPECIES: IclR family transcriptional regulator C-terminal domain-containing protein [Burkholderia]MBN3744358.1 helix-turn-helix domain-containing protein [Burkholderia sp. Se-20373]MBN3768408.1 helix-turn-helix domain-containing protein [Burkholderia sp. Se-20378]MBN3793640.1 helix-turn-helix domain-containing protein [Burkholderia sp. Ac-20392]VWB70167.1 IclR family transcriptional regulator [Burkholderia lata]